MGGFEETMRKLIKDAIHEEFAEFTSCFAKPATQPQTSQRMTVKELSDYLCRTVSWVYKHSHEIPHLQMGKRGTLYFNRRDVDEWLEKIHVLAYEEIQ